jgi:uncharacterized RDD family membrane protein YckC
MKTIEDLKVEKTIYKKERDADGNIIQVPYTKMVARTPVVVSRGVRFGYFMIDLVFFYILTFLIGLIIGIVVVATGNLQLLNPDTAFYKFLDYMGYPIYFLYYAIFEGLAAASLGKLICGYTVIDEQANKVSFPRALLRTICRYIPFDHFSCFAERGWHDTISKTYVVKKSEKIELQKLMGSFVVKEENILD